MATIVPVPKKAKITELNYCPVALTSVIMKCFERQVKDHITSNLLTAPIGPQMTQSQSHCTLSYPIWTRDNLLYVRMLFIDYSSAFNTIVSSKLVIKLETPLCN